MKTNIQQINHVTSKQCGLSHLRDFGANSIVFMVLFSCVNLEARDEGRRKPRN